MTVKAPSGSHDQGTPVDLRQGSHDQGTTARAHERRPKGRSGSPKGTDETRIRRIGWQLAMLTGVLLVVLLVAMGGAVYLQTRDALLAPIKASIVSRGYQEVGEGIGRQPRPGSPPGPNSPGEGNPGGPGPGLSPSGPGSETFEGNPNTVYLSVITPNLQVQRSTKGNGGPTGAFGYHIPDRRAAAHVLNSGEPQFTSTTYEDTPYLVYTTPIFGGPNYEQRVIGVVQTATNQSQYQENIASLVKILVLVGSLGLAAAIAITAFVTQRALFPIRTSLRRQRNFVADAAHELRTPLTIIRSTAEIGIGHSEGEEQQRAELTLKETSHLTRLVNDLSLLARADTGTLDFERTRLDLSSLISDTADDVEVLAEDRGIHMETSVVHGVHVVGDAVRLRQVLLILLDNALKHSPEGGTVRVNLDNVRRRAMLRVQDSGPGIAAEDLPHIFDRFYQSDKARTGEGTGLGLAIAQSIVQGQHGSISAGNSSAGGAVFTVSLPVAGS